MQWYDVLMEPVVVKQIGQDLTIGYSGKLLGNTNVIFGPDAEDNFAKFMLKFPGKAAYDMPAAGKDNIVDVDTVSPEQLFDMEADVLLTRKSSSLLVLKAADCIPLVFYIPGQKILALAHVGTSGAALHLARKTLQAMGAKPESILCYIGPAISQKSYRFVNQDISDKKLDDSWNNYITEEPDGTHINLFDYVIDELKAAGMPDKNIRVESVDTGGDSAYFSHRRHKLTGEPDGRNCFAVCLKG